MNMWKALITTLNKMTAYLQLKNTMYYHSNQLHTLPCVDTVGRAHPDHNILLHSSKNILLWEPGPNRSNSAKRAYKTKTEWLTSTMHHVQLCLIWFAIKCSNRKNSLWEKEIKTETFKNVITMHCHCPNHQRYRTFALHVELMMMMKTCWLAETLTTHSRSLSCRTVRLVLVSTKWQTCWHCSQLKQRKPRNVLNSMQCHSYVLVGQWEVQQSQE